MYCSNCGNQIDDRAVICPKCGVSTYQKSQKSKNTAAIIALFLGGLGIHKFYVGSWGWGIVYLLFCWSFIPAILALIEAIVLFTMDERKFDAKYNLSPSSAFKW